MKISVFEVEIWWKMLIKSMESVDKSFGEMQLDTLVFLYWWQGPIIYEWMTCGMYFDLGWMIDGLMSDLVLFYAINNAIAYRICSCIVYNWQFSVYTLFKRVDKTQYIHNNHRNNNNKRNPIIIYCIILMYFIIAVEKL